MTGGRVVVLGPTGRNFGAGMSGGIAYVYDPDGAFPALVNHEMVDLEALDEDDLGALRAVIERHRELTGSTVAQQILLGWITEAPHFRKVMPKDYRRVLVVLRDAERDGLSEGETMARVMEAAHG
jgi:glutamate synthase (NADPH/NADH) large chain